MKSNSIYVYFSLGRPKFSTIELFFRAVFFLGFTFYFVNANGVVGAAQAFFLTSMVMFFVSNFFVKSMLKLTVVDQLGLYVRPLLATILMSLMVCIFKLYWLTSSFVNDLVLIVLIGVIVYIVSVLLLWIIFGKSSGVEEQLVRLINSRIHRQT